MSYGSKKKSGGSRASFKDIEDALGERIGAQVTISLHQDPDGYRGDYVYVVQQKLHGKVITETVGESLSDAVLSLAEVIPR